jgi:hypothetical protein
MLLPRHRCHIDVVRPDLALFAVEGGDLRPPDVHPGSSLKTMNLPTSETLPVDFIAVATVMAMIGEGVAGCRHDDGAAGR